MRSFSEIETTIKRATKAIGFSWGISEEVGKRYQKFIIRINQSILEKKMFSIGRGVVTQIYLKVIIF